MHPQYGHPSPLVHETSPIPPPGHPNSRPPPTPEPYAFRLPTRPLVWTSDSCSPQQRPYAPAAAAGGQRMLNLDKNLGQGGSKDLLRHLPAPTPLPYDLYAAASTTAAYSSGGVGHSMGYVIPGSLHFLQPLQAYAFFRTHLTHAEAERISALGEDDYRSLVDECRQWTTERELGTLRDWEWKEGMRRMDCLREGGSSEARR
ncbi:hypothetical protein EDD15DRAFT_2368619 [Pisolithus albus]|nr:hypothetical protein EDD15DRAFT_2368619 [Pisolithus albus]